MLVVGKDRFQFAKCKVCNYELGLVKLNLRKHNDEAFEINIRCANCDFSFYFNYLDSVEFRCKCNHEFHDKKCYCGCERFDYSTDYGDILISEPSFLSFTLCR